MDIDTIGVFSLGASAAFLSAITIEKYFTAWLYGREGDSKVGRSRRSDPFRWNHPRPDAVLDQLLVRDDWLVIDLETTGYSARSEIIEIAILDAYGNVLLDQMIMPKGRIPSKASEIHGIYRRDLKGCQSWPDIAETMRSILGDRPLISYNGEFEERLLMQTALAWGAQPIDRRVGCIMRAYAAHRRVPHRWRENDFKWHKLDAACRHEKIDISIRHRAAADAELCRRLALTVANARQARVS